MCKNILWTDETQIYWDQNDGREESGEDCFIPSPVWWCTEPKLWKLCQCPDIYGPNCTYISIWRPGNHLTIIVIIQIICSLFFCLINELLVSIDGWKTVKNATVSQFPRGDVLKCFSLLTYCCKANIHIWKATLTIIQLPKLLQVNFLSIDFSIKWLIVSAPTPISDALIVLLYFWRIGRTDSQVDMKVSQLTTGSKITPHTYSALYLLSNILFKCTNYVCEMYAVYSPLKFPQWTITLPQYIVLHFTDTAH